MTTYVMTTTASSTNIRPDHNTNNTSLNAAGNGIPAGVVLKGAELFTATVELKTPAEVIYQMVGDQWLKTSYNAFSGWVAYKHKGQLVCRDFKTIVDPVPPPSELLFYPESVVWEYVEPSTSKTVRLQYKFEKEV